VALGSDVVLGCSAAAFDVGGDVLTSATMSYTWTVDGHAVPVKTLQFYNHSLYVPTVTTDDAGLYQCHVIGNSSTFSSRNATVVIACKTIFITITTINRVDLIKPVSNVRPSLRASIRAYGRLSSVHKKFLLF